MWGLPLRQGIGNVSSPLLSSAAVVTASTDDLTEILPPLISRRCRGSSSTRCREKVEVALDAVRRLRTACHSPLVPSATATVSSFSNGWWRECWLAFPQQLLEEAAAVAVEVEKEL